MPKPALRARACPGSNRAEQSRRVPPRNDANVSQLAFMRAEPGRVAPECRQQARIRAVVRPTTRARLIRARSASEGT